MDKNKALAEVYADIACGVSLPAGFGNTVDGRDGERIGTNVATWGQWREFFAAFFNDLAKG